MTQSSSIPAKVMTVVIMPIRDASLRFAKNFIGFSTGIYFLKL